MTMGIPSCLRLAVVFLALLQVVFAQQCYYPNGSEAPDTEKPCSSDTDSACCPEKWACLDNGLCFYEPDNLYGRYSCTDKDWKSGACPSNMCTYGMKAAGGEAITQCSNHNDQWCCDANRVDVDCCQESPKPRPFFVLQNGQAYGTAGVSTGSGAPDLAKVTGLAEGSGSPSGSSSPSSTSPPSSSGSQSASTDTVPSSGSSDSSGTSSTAPSSPVTSVETRVSSGSAGPSTLVITTVLLPPASSTSGPTPTPKSKSNIGLIVGCAVGIPLGLALLGILIWLFRKRAQQNRSPSSDNILASSNGPSSPEFVGGKKLGYGATKYASNDPGVPELGGQGVGPERPISLIPGKAEMDSGAGFAPGTAPHAPHLVGVGGGSGTGHTPQSSWGSAPPGYSPGMNENTWPPAAQHTEGGRYIPYRPPPDHAARGLHNVPEMAELPSITTPPEVAELGNPSPPART